MSDKIEMVTVCNKCLKATCWQGLFMCDESQTAGIIDMPIEDLKKINREHPSHWIGHSFFKDKESKYE